MQVDLRTIRRLRRTVAAVAAELGVSAPAISQFEAGRLTVLGPEKRILALQLYARLAEEPPCRAKYLLKRHRFSVQWFPDHIVVSRGNIQERHELFDRLPRPDTLRDMRRPYMSLKELSTWCKEQGIRAEPSSLHKFEHGRKMFSDAVTAKLLVRYMSFYLEEPRRKKWKFHVIWHSADRITVKRGLMESTYDRPR
jgi:hypothetical protein